MIKMEQYSNEPVGTVDPEVRAYVTSLVSALGGNGGYDDGRYVLGDEALACLRDLKRWLKLYDEKTNRLDVARVLAERNLVKGDLLEILAAWPEEDFEDKLKSRVALACLELLVPLTWPIEKNDMNATANHFRNTPYLQLAQISYKREILEHPSSSILRTAARVGLGSFSIPVGERTQRDEGIIRLLLYFYRNIIMISAPATLPVEWNENEVSRSATIHALHHQDVFPLLLTISSNMGEDFNTQDVAILEILFHLLKGIDVHKLFLNETQLEARHANGLRDLISKEDKMIRGYTKNAPTRHNRFGTMIWVQRDEERVSAVSGQDVLSDKQHTLAKMDRSKKWNRPTRRLKEDTTSKSFDLPVPLTNSAIQELRQFVEEFLDSGFNPLFSHLRRAVEREAERVSETHSHQFFYLTAWFLEAERARRQSKKSAAPSKEKGHKPTEVESFGIVASVLNQETFILLGRFMQEKFDTKEWSELNAGMRAFTQILLTVQMMAESSLEEDRDIADNIQNRIFYEEATHDRILAILRGYKDQSFGYLDACTELAHVFLRMLERYSKENIDLQVRSRRRARKKTKEATVPKDNEENGNDNDSEAEELLDAQKASKERKFDFNRFSARFVNQSCVNTFVSLLSYYKTLNDDQLRRTLRFFHRVAFKQNMSVLLFRLDIIALLNRVVEGPDGLERSHTSYKEWVELVKQVFRKLIKKMSEEEAMVVELLFSKISATTHYLEYGYEKQTLSSNPRAPFELEFVKELSLREQLGIVIATMLEDGEEQGFSVTWVENILRSAADERKSWEAEREARIITESVADQLQEKSREAPSIGVKADNDARRLQMFKYNKLRLLMTLVGFQREGEEDDADALWIIPSDVTSTKLGELAEWVWNIRKDPPYTFGEENIRAGELLRRKTKKTDDSHILNTFGDDSDDANALDEEDLLYAASGPSVRKSTALEQLKKKRRRRQRPDTDDNQSTDSEAHASKRKPKPLLAKSKEFIYDSDEDAGSEADRNFFAEEETRRSDQVSKIIESLRTRVGDDTSSKKRKNIDSAESTSKKLRSSDNEDEDGDDSDLSLRDDDADVQTESTSNHLEGAQSRSNGKDIGFSDQEDDSDTPPSSEVGEKIAFGSGKVDRMASTNTPRSTEKVGDSRILGDDEDSDDEDIGIQRNERRRNNVTILDDSDEE